MGDANKNTKFQDPDLTSIKYDPNNYLFDSPDYNEISIFQKIILAFKMLKKNFFILFLMYTFCITFSIITLFIAMFPVLIGFSSVILQIIDSDNEKSPTFAKLFQPFYERFFQLVFTGLFFLTSYIFILLVTNSLPLNITTIFELTTYNPNISFLVQKIIGHTRFKEFPTLFILITLFYIMIINIVYFYSAESYSTAIETIQVSFGILFTGILKWLEALAVMLVIVSLYYIVLAGLSSIFADYLTYITKKKTFIAFLIKNIFSLTINMPPVIFVSFIFGITYRQVRELD